MKAALCDCQTWMCQCVLVLVLVDRPAALWCSDLSLVASFRFTLWSSLFWFCCHVCWWQITATLQEDVFRCGPARFFVLSGGSQPVFVSNDGITCPWTAWRWAGISVMLSLLLWPENSRVMFCMRDKSHLCPQQWAWILPAYSQHDTRPVITLVLAEWAWPRPASYGEARRSGDELIYGDKVKEIINRMT